MKHYRRIATRYDKTAISFMAFLYLAAILLWINYMATEPREAQLKFHSDIYLCLQQQLFPQLARLLLVSGFHGYGKEFFH